MSSDRKEQHNPFAFPVHTEYQYPHSEGMTLRDYFAAKAMIGLITNQNTMDVIAQEPAGQESKLLARQSFEMADAMLAERAK